MKTMNKYRASLILAVVVASLTACNDYLDVVPKNDITTIESTFEKREDAEQWLTTCMSFRDSALANYSYNPAFWGSDEVVADEYMHNEYLGRVKSRIPGIMIAEGNQKTQNPYGDIWSQQRFYGGIRYCNLFLEQIKGTYDIEEEERRMWIAEVRACKAHLYFELIRRYGPIVLVPKNIDANADISTMQVPRSPIDSCFNATVELLDSAIVDLPIQSGLSSDFYCFYSKEGAACLKAMVLLYAASPLFNGNEMFASFTNKNGERLFPAYDKEKWHRAALAADEAISIAKNAGHELMSGESDRHTKIMNVMHDIEDSYNNFTYSNKEALVVVRNHNNRPEIYYHPPILSTYRKYYDRNIKGGVYATMKMAEMFYTEHGLPLNEDKQWLTNRYQMSNETDENYRNVVKIGEPVLNLHRRREPRFYADLTSHGTLWYHRVNNASSIYEAIECNLLQGQMLGTDRKLYTSSVPQCISGYYIKKFDKSDVGLQQYSTYLSFSGERTDILWRLPDLLLASSEAWNEYLDAPDERVYKGIDEVRARAGIPSVRDAWSSYARNPQNATTKAGMRNIIRQEENIEFCFEGRRFWNLRRWMTASEELNQSIMGWNILGDTEQKFFNNFQGPIVVWKERRFTAPRDYFFPINAEEILISGVRQNLGW
ncbi:MAG: RagB/SusD family nutrient uptake outer membrane protein [Prevotella sp.]|jgi:hypothetical protein